jgi:hypothetical protein
MLLRKTGHHAADLDIPTHDPFRAIEDCLEPGKDRRRLLASRGSAVPNERVRY